MGGKKTTRREFIGNVSGGAVALGMMPLVEPIFASTIRPEGTGYVYDDRMLNHIIEQGHVECPERLIKIQEKMALIAEEIVQPVLSVQMMMKMAMQ